MARAAVLVLCLAAMMGVLSGCGRSSAGASAADSAFLSEVENAVPDIASLRSDTQLVRLGHAVCDDFSSGASYEQVADRLSTLSGSDTLPPEDLGAVITAAADNYCPQFHDRVSLGPAAAGPAI